MGLEYEYRYVNFNKNQIVKNLKKIGGKKIGSFLFKVMVFQHPLKTEKTYVRIRDEGYRTVMTFKDKMGEKFVNEHEVIINDFDTGVKILLGLGCKKKYYYEKIREIWKVDDTEVIFDTNPGRPLDIMEVESETKKELDLIVKKLNISDLSHDNFKDDEIYEKYFGIVIPATIDLTFKNSKKELGKLVKKHKVEFNILMERQKKIYDKILKQ